MLLFKAHLKKCNHIASLRNSLQSVQLSPSPHALYAATVPAPIATLSFLQFFDTKGPKVWRGWVLFLHRFFSCWTDGAKRKRQGVSRFGVTYDFITPSKPWWYPTAHLQVFASEGINADFNYYPISPADSGWLHKAATWVRAARIWNLGTRANSLYHDSWWGNDCQGW